MIDLIEALEDMIAGPPREMTETTVYVLRREHFDYHCDANDVPRLTEDELEALPTVIVDLLQDDFVAQAIQGVRDND